MKLRVYIGVVLMAVMVGCKSPTTSPRPSSVEEGEAYRMLVEIDSLMWQQPDSALAMLLEYLSCRDAMIVSSNDAMDTMRRIQCVSTTFDSHYAQLLTSELLFKNNYAQSNRTELLQAVARLKSEHPELNETERHILLLNFLHFRIKEEADLLGFRENTVAKYRSELLKKVGKSPISDLLD